MPNNLNRIRPIPHWLALTVALAAIMQGNVLAQGSFGHQPAWHQVEIPRRAIYTPTELPTLWQSRQSMRTKTYVDGLARPIQVTQVGATPAGTDLVQIHRYAPDGQTLRYYLPHPQSGNTGAFAPAGSSAQLQFYASAPAGIERTTYPFRTHVMERSPRALPIRQVEAGDAQNASTQPGRKVIHRTNTGSEVRMVAYNGAGGTLTTTTYWPASTLTCKEVTDENGDITRDWTDQKGKLVMQETLIESGGINVYAQTFHAYDIYGNLKLTIPPQGSKVMLNALEPVNADFFAKYCFQYNYDGQQRLVESRDPGEAPVFHIYDPKGRLVLQQDGNLRPQAGWMYFKYDRADRLILKGIHYHTTAMTLGRPEMQALCDLLYANGTVKYFEERSSSPTFQYYTNQSFPTLGQHHFLLANYYDDYDLDRNGTPDHAYQAPVNFTVVTPSGSTFGKLTISRVADSRDAQSQNSPRVDAYFYDALGQLVHQQATHGTLIEKTWSIYNFDKQPAEILRELRAGTVSHRFLETFTYDHQGRLLDHTLKYGTELPVTLSRSGYNELGQQSKQSWHVASTGTALQGLDYTRNLQGQVTSIVSKPKAGSSRPAYGLYYSYHTKLASMPAHRPRFANDISAMHWVSPADSIARGYLFEYERGGRLKKAEFGRILQTGTPLSQDYSLPLITYDHNGNIESLSRRGPTTPGGTQFNFIDRLEYRYFGNQLISVTDATPSTTGNGLDYKNNGVNATPGMTNTYRYRHDANGNIIEDLGKGLVIQYDVHNMLASVTRRDGARTVYAYDGATRKTKATTTIGTATTTVQYFQNYLLEAGVLKAVVVPEGQLQLNGSSKDYVYAVRDMLGSAWGQVLVRSNAVLAYREMAYYPFGMEHNATANLMLADRQQRLQGGEWINDLGQQWAQLGFRQYDPQLSRWLSSDPIARSNPGESPYAFAHNDPVNQTDPLGLDGDDPDDDEDDDERWIDVERPIELPEPSGEGAGVLSIYLPGSVSLSVVNFWRKAFTDLNEISPFLAAGVAVVGWPVVGLSVWAGYQIDGVLTILTGYGQLW